jgi:hypothetical protein
MMRGFVNAMYDPTVDVAARRGPWATPPGANREGTSGRLPTAMVPTSYGHAHEAANVPTEGRAAS